MSVTNTEVKTHENKLIDQGFHVSSLPADRADAVFRGREVTKQVFTKNEDEKWGKIPTVIATVVANVALGAVATFFTAGLLPIFSSSFRKFIHKNISNAAKNPNEPLVGGKTARLALGIIGMLAIAGIPLLLSKSYRDETWNPVVHGRAEKTLYYEKPVTDDDKHKEVARLGYDKSDSTSIADFMRLLQTDAGKQQYPELSIEVIEGDLVVRENRRPGISAALIVPKGDYTKACSIKFWNPKTGEAITHSQDQYRAIRKILASQETIAQKLTELAQKKGQLYAKRKLKDSYDEENPNTQKLIEQGARQFKEAMQKRSVRLSDEYALVSGSDDLNNRGNGHFVSFDNQTKKAFKKIDQLEPKGPLEGNPIQSPPRSAPPPPVVPPLVPNVPPQPNPAQILP